MAHILDEIVAAKRKELERLKTKVTLRDLEARIAARPAALNLAGALTSGDVRIIGEIKRRSPAKGLLRADFDPVRLACAYAENGAAAISVLTNADHFGGSLADLEAVCSAVNPLGVPVLRKEFVFDPYQVHESRASGADAVLLIVAILEPQMLRELMGLAREFWMQCLVEVHDEAEMKVALDADAEIVGINNRDLRTFKTDLAVTERLALLVPEGKVVVSESGIAGREDIDRVGRAGAHAVLVGESLATEPDPGAKLRALL